MAMAKSHSKIHEVLRIDTGVAGSVFAARVFLGIERKSEVERSPKSGRKKTRRAASLR